MSDLAPLRILCIGLDPQAIAIVSAACSGAEVTRIDSVEDFANSFEQWNDDSFDAMFCGPMIEGMAAIELAQVLLNQAPATIKFYVTQNSTNYEPRMLIKNGFTATFLIPIDVPLIKKSIQENVIPATVRERSMRTVRLLDIEGNEPLPFETFLFLPLNKKYIRFTSANQPVEPAKVEKMQARHMSQLWVDHRDMNKFYQFSAKKLRELGDSNGVSSTEKQEKLKDCVRSLFSDIFDASVKADFDQGRETIKQCESIISNYITKGASSNWYKKLLGSIGEGGDSYNHASNVSTFAALFGIATGHPHPEDLAMAGLFHDLGLAQLPVELLGKKESELTEAEKPIYYTHAEKSVVMIKNKRIIIPDAVEKAILMHHEAWHGRGWPKQLPYQRISNDAQILSFADQFDYLTRFEEGKGRLRPLEALDEIRRTSSINPEIISVLRKLFEKESALGKTA